MISALDAEECAACPVVNHCDAWNRAVTWAHMKGVRPCRPVALYGTAHARLTITEEPIPSRRIPIIDADAIQKERMAVLVHDEVHRFSLRRER